MGKKIIPIVCSVSVFVLLTIFPGAIPTWSAPGETKQVLQNSPDKSVLDREEPKTGKKGEKSVKKKVLKKAGAAAAVGVVGKKATSGLTKGLKPTEKD